MYFYFKMRHWQLLSKKIALIVSLPIAQTFYDLNEQSQKPDKPFSIDVKNIFVY